MSAVRNWTKYNLPLYLMETGRCVFNMKFRPGQRSEFLRQKYGSRRKLTAQQANDFYREKILSGEPFLGARLGSGEMRRVNRYFMRKFGLCKDYRPDHIASVILNHSPELADWYCERLVETMPLVDIMPAWCAIAEPYLIRQFAKDAKLCNIQDIEPFWYENPWTSALKGKKVLVINPFDESIQMQYKKRELLFKDKDMLPEFELHTLKSVMVLTPEDNIYGTIIDVVNDTYEKAMAIDFDIAILGCGQVGMLLAGMFKRQGKQAIYMGGALQLMFGIRGKRWDNKEEYAELFNEHWIYPVEEPPAGAKRIEGGCYWG